MEGRDPFAALGVVRGCGADQVRMFCLVPGSSQIVKCQLEPEKP